MSLLTQGNVLCNKLNCFDFTDEDIPKCLSTFWRQEYAITGTQ